MSADRVRGFLIVETDRLSEIEVWGTAIWLKLGWLGGIEVWGTAIWLKMGWWRE